MSSYRADIDGLRGIAIILVVLFHGGFTAFGGGYVGVDVFFVISGYLITALILGEIRNNTFSLVVFYERRMRRLLPALFCVVAVISVLCYIVLMPSDLEAFGLSVVATISFMSNFLFWRDAGYFAGPADLTPLLHTWSLAVEEQFYLIFPALLLWIRRDFGKYFITITLTLLILSLVISIWSATHAPVAGFYLIPARFWELLVGALLAMGLIPASLSTSLCNVAAFAGLTLIFWSAMTFSSATPFPGAAALLPCMGTALVIYAGMTKETLARRLLSLRPIVFVGLISYSYYLWHWPLLVLLKQLVVPEPTLAERCAVLLGALLLSILSWHYVEKPFRGRRGMLSSPQLFRVAGIATIALLAVGATFYSFAGLPQRLPADVVALAAAAYDRNPNTERCFNPPLAAIDGASVCRIGAESAKAPTFILWGDSTANAITTAVDNAASAQGRVGLIAAAAACPPLLDVMRSEPKQGYTCAEFNRAVLDLVRNDQALGTVILAARWVISADGTRYKHEAGNSVLITDAQSAHGGLLENEAVFRRGLARTLHALASAGKRIIVVGPIPEVGWRVPDILAKAAYLGNTADIAPSFAEFFVRQQKVLHTFALLHKEVPFQLVLPHTLLCDELRCPVERDGKPLYHDEEHISNFGASTLTPLFSSVLREPVVLEPVPEQLNLPRTRPIDDRAFGRTH